MCGSCVVVCIVCLVACLGRSVSFTLLNFQWERAHTAAPGTCQLQEMLGQQRGASFRAKFQRKTCMSALVSACCCYCAFL